MVRAEEVLARVDFTWERLEKLAWSALGDRMRARGITLDEDRLRRAHELYVEVGLEWAKRYDPALARGVSFASSCYRRMLPRLADFLRGEHGDERRGTPLMQVPTAEMPEVFEVDPVSLQEVAREVERRLPSEWLRRAFRQLPLQMALFGMTLSEAADANGVSLERAEALLADLQAVLVEQGWHEPPTETGEVVDLFAAMRVWSSEGEDLRRREAA